MPSPLDQVGRRRFAFYPSIANAESNEWMLSAATPSEVKVVNARTGHPLWIPRHFVQGISETNDPILIIGLTKELELRSGEVLPRIKRVIEIPLAATSANEIDASEPTQASARRRHSKRGPAPVVGIRLEPRFTSRPSKAMIVFAVSTLVACLLAAGVFSDWINLGVRASGFQGQKLNLTPALAAH